MRVCTHGKAGLVWLFLGKLVGSATQWFRTTMTRLYNSLKGSHKWLCPRSKISLCMMHKPSCEHGASWCLCPPTSLIAPLWLEAEALGPHECRTEKYPAVKELTCEWGERPYTNIHNIRQWEILQRTKQSKGNGEECKWQLCTIC